MDDFIILVKDKYEAKYIYDLVEIFLNNRLKLQLNKKSRYFKNKEGLFLAWLSSVIQNAYEEMKLTCDEVSSPVEKLEKMAEYKIKYFERNKTTIKAYMENNQLFLRGISRRKEHPMACVYTYSASIIREIKKMSEDTAYLLANIFDSMINCYIECSSENDDLMAKKNEIVKRFLAMLEVGV